ncbi:MAG: ribosome maturation factor RimP [Firmicutes bacterium]|nr:ribosome maturation factor RimP [Bacillota bacterium]
MASKITDRIAAYMEDFPKEEGISLYHCEYVKEGPDRYLRVYIDVDEEGRYVSTDDCEKVSKFLEERLDADDPIEGTYVLEVSSPGMDRPLITEAHYQKYMGELVDVRLYKPYEGEKLLTGTLEAKTDETVSIRPEGREEVITLPLKEVAKVQLAVVL